MGTALADEFDFEAWASESRPTRPIRERLMAAVDHMATSLGDVSTRLAGAYLLIGLEGENELPENLREEYREITRRITRKKAYAEGARLFTVARSIRGKKAAEAARQIVLLHRRLEAQSPPGLVSTTL